MSSEATAVLAALRFRARAAGRHPEGLRNFPWRPSLSDPRDEFGLELAVTANCDAIVTHNVRDFAGAKDFKPQVLTPSVFLKKVWKGL